MATRISAKLALKCIFWLDGSGSSSGQARAPFNGLFLRFPAHTAPPLPPPPERVKEPQIANAILRHSQTRHHWGTRAAFRCDGDKGRGRLFRSGRTFPRSGLIRLCSLKPINPAPARDDGTVPPPFLGRFSQNISRTRISSVQYCSH
jgi:hypothetical protein